MKFIEALVEMEHSKMTDERSYRMFNRFENDDIILSIQASYSHYCNPRTTLKDLSQYTTMEFAIISKISDEFIPVSEALPNFTRMTEVDECYEGQVYGYVPVGVIESLYQELFKGV